MKKIFKMTLFKKIFLMILGTMLVILFAFMGVTWQIQRDAIINTYFAQINKLDNYNQGPSMYGYKIDKILNHIGLSWENDSLTYEEALKKVEELDINKLLIEDPVYIGDVAIVRTSFEDGNHLIKSSFNSDNEYLTFGRIDYDISFLSEEKKESLLMFLKNNMENNENGFVLNVLEYSIEEDKISYLKWGNEEYGERTNNIKKGLPYDFYICDHFYRQETAGSHDMTISKYDIEEVIRSIEGICESYGSTTTDVITINNRTYLIYMTYLGGDSNDNQFVNILDIMIIDDLDSEVLSKCLDDYKWVYLPVIVIIVFSSWILSKIIASPIKRIQTSALMISQHHLDEEINVKSNDEIGSLARSLDMMRVHLKDTISKLNEEIEHVKRLESLRKEFINQFTHEMKTPLGIINGYSELIEETDDSQEKEKYLNIINRETIKINNLIQSMLKLSRLEAGKVELNKKVIDLEDIVTEIVDEYEILLMKKNIKIEMNCINKYITGDRNQLMTVIRNFLSNAIKHTDTKIVITINEGVSVYNEGKPIAEDRLEGIWYTFVTYDKSGSGLGLAICRSILELHNYQYGVTNKDKGVEFYFYE